MQKGAGALTSEQFADRMEQTGATLFAETGDEHIVIGCKMLSHHADTVVPLFWEMICDPRFDEGELSRLKREIITGLQAETSDANALAHKHFYPLVCGKNHPAGRMHSIASIKRIGITEIRSFYSNYFLPADAVLVVAGDGATQEGGGWRSLFQTWTGVRGAPPSKGGPIPELTETSIKLIDKHDITQTYFMIGHPAPGELVVDRNALALANYVLGGGNFSSRLMERVRSDKGKTYGISSQIMCNRDCGIFMVSTATLSGQTTEVLTTILDVYHEFSAHGVTDAELMKAKEFAIGNMAFQMEGIGNITDKVLWLSLYGRPLSYIERFDEMIAAMDKDAVNQAIVRYLSSKYFAVTAVGRKEEVGPQLSGFGKVTTVNFRSAP
jgi:zinc protease